MRLLLPLLLLMRLCRRSSSGSSGVCVRGCGGSPARRQREDPLEPLLGGVGAGADEAAGGAGLGGEFFFFEVEERVLKFKKKLRARSIDGIVRCFSLSFSLGLLTSSALAASPEALSGRHRSPCPGLGAWIGRASAARRLRTTTVARRSWFFLERKKKVLSIYFFQFLFFN